MGVETCIGFGDLYNNKTKGVSKQLRKAGAGPQIFQSKGRNRTNALSIMINCLSNALGEAINTLLITAGFNIKGFSRRSSSNLQVSANILGTLLKW